MQKDRAISPQIQFRFIRPRAGDCKNTAVAPHTPTWIQVQFSHFHTNLTSRPTGAQLAAYQGYCSCTALSRNAAATKTLDKDTHASPTQMRSRLIFTTPGEAAPDSPCIFT